MKQKLKQIIMIIFIILLLNNFLIGTCYANDYAIETIDDIVDVITGCIGVLVAFLTLPLRIVAILAGYAINALTAVIAYVDGATSGNSANTFITPFDIFFNKVNLFDINFFDIKNDNSIVDQMRISVASWYYVMRTISCAILLVILIYVGIRMAISTVASDRAMYKKMLVDWAASLALIFVLQYVMLFAIYTNDAIVKAIALVVNSEEIANVFNVIAGMAVPTSLSLKALKTIISLDSLAATVIFCMLVWQTLGLVFSYFNRMLKIAFLIIISPLISLTYSIDKMGDGKAQALGTWLKEFVFTILIQPFHCVIYMCFIDAAFDILVEKSGLGGVTDGGGALAASIVAILCVKFTKEGEKIVRKIFAFKDDNSTTSLAAGMAASTIALSKAKNIGKTARNTVNGARNLVKNISPGVKTAIAEAGAAIGAVTNIGKSNDSDEEGERKTTFKERKENISNRLDDASAIWRERVYNNKLINGTRKKAKEYLKENEEARKDKIEAEKQKLISQNPTLSEKRAESMARLNVAKGDNPAKKVIKGAKSKVLEKSYVAKRLYDFKNSETASVLADINRSYMAAGVGVMVGSGIYGTNGNLVTAITSGAAVSSGLSEYMSGSKNTIVSGIQKNLKKISEVKNSKDAIEKINEIDANKEKYDVGDGKEGEKKLKELLSAIIKEAGLDKDENFNQKIDSTIQSVKRSPLYADSAIENFIKDVKGNSKSFGDNFETKEKELNDFGNKVSVSYQLQNSENAGISLNTIIENISEDFGNEPIENLREEKEKKINKVVADVSHLSSMTENVDIIYNEVKSKFDEKELESLFKKLKAESDELGKLAKKESDDIARAELEKARETVVVKTAQLVARSLKEEEGDLGAIGKELALEYQARLDEAIKILQEKSKTGVNGKLSKIQRDLVQAKTNIERQNIYKNLTQ